VSINFGFSSSQGKCNNDDLIFQKGDPFPRSQTPVWERSNNILRYQAGAWERG